MFGNQPKLIQVEQLIYLVPSGLTFKWLILDVFLTINMYKLTNFQTCSSIILEISLFRIIK